MFGHESPDHKQRVVEVIDIVIVESDEQIERGEELKK
jgi:hypothetical protein